MKKLVILTLLFTIIPINSWSQINYKTASNIPYYNETVHSQDRYLSERCVLDVYYPENVTDFPTIVWFHGGGLTTGEKHIPAELKEKGFCVVAVNYRLHPKVNCPKYIEDAVL